MPRIFTYSDFVGKSPVVRTYADKHTPVILCEDTALRGELFPVKVRIGINAKHPVLPEHHFEFVQLWNLETLVGEMRLERMIYNREPVQITVDFSVMPQVSMRLTALAYCNKHGLWRSEERLVCIQPEGLYGNKV